MSHLNKIFMDEVSQYNDGNGCTRRQLVDRLLVAVQQQCGQDSDYDAEKFDQFLHTDPSAQYAIRQQWAQRMESAMGNDNLLDALRKVGCSAEYNECSTIGVMNGPQWVCANHAVSTRLWLEMVPVPTRIRPAEDAPVSGGEPRLKDGGAESRRCTCGHPCPSRHERDVKDAQCEYTPDCELMGGIATAPTESSADSIVQPGRGPRVCRECGHLKLNCKCVFPEPAGEEQDDTATLAAYPATDAGQANQRDLIVFANWIYSTAREQVINECLEVVTRRRPQVLGNIPESDTAAWVAAKSYLDAEHESIIRALASLRQQGANSEGK